MIDTNQLNEVLARLATAQAAAPAVQSTLNAWYLVAIGIFAVLVHGLHVVLQAGIHAGGVKNVWRAFWDGPAGKQ